MDCCGPWPCTTAYVVLSPAGFTRHEQPCTQMQTSVLPWTEITSSAFSSILALLVMAARSAKDNPSYLILKKVNCKDLIR